MKSHPLLVRFVVWICLPAAAGLVLGLLYLRGSLPAAMAQVRVSGLQETVRIRRDAHGVPYVNANSDNDAYFALGYLHAQDRLWQMEMQRRLAQGRLSEVLGQQTFDDDKWMRTLDLYRAAESSWNALSAAAKASLEAYANGVNAYLNEGRTLPPEFLLLGVKPQPWRAIDSLAWFKVFSLSQSNGMRQEANRYVLRRYLTQAQWSELDRDYPARAPVTADVLPAIQGIALMGLKLQKELGVGGRYVGSNAWVISGALTESGMPILANDPHLNLQMPSLFYVATLSAPGLAVSGMSVVGLPIILFGRNAHIAWGATNMIADTQDLYVLETEPDRPNHYKVDREWKTLEVHPEEIRIRSAFPSTLRKPLEPVRIQVRRSHLGPVVSDALAGLDQPVCLHWLGLEEGDTSYEAIFRLGYAKDWQEFNRALELLVSPAVNLMYADTSNNIGYLGAGKIPIRTLGDGSLPVPAADSRYAWKGYIPFAEMPRILNPQPGYLVNANNKIVGDAYPYFISRDWAAPARAERVIAMIEEARKAHGKIRFEDVQKMQGDVQDLEAVELKDYLLRVLGSRIRPGTPLERLRQWNGDMTREQTPAAIFNMWLDRLRDDLLLDDLQIYGNNRAQASVLRDSVQAVTALQVKRMMTDPNYDWCDNRRTQVRESCADIALMAFDEAVAELRKRHGQESNWQWGGIHQAVFKHVPFSEVNLLELLFERRIASAGSESTVDVAPGRYSEAEGFKQEFGAVFRQVISLGSGKPRHAYMNSTGQSGNPLSSHFDDMVKPFNRVQLFELNDTGVGSGDAVLTLEPARLVAGDRG